MFSRCRLPPESLPVSSSPPSPVSSSIRATASRGAFSSRAKSCRFSRTVSFE